MKNVVKYKQFVGTVNFSAEDEVFYGKIEGINDLVTFEGSSVQELKESFEEGVEDYLTLCEENGKEVFRSFKGSFNVRIDPALHSKAYELALLQGLSLNQFVQKAIEDRIARE